MDQKHLLDKWVHDGKKHLPNKKTTAQILSHSRFCAVVVILG